MTLQHSSVVDGETEVETNRPLQFVFDGNVNNITVKGNNARCFMVTDETGVNVPVDVIFFDDQIERDMRRDIHLEIRGGMEYGKTYTIIIDKNLMAKNLNTLGQDIKLTFTTASNLQPAIGSASGGENSQNAEVYPQASANGNADTVSVENPDMNEAGVEDKNNFSSSDRKVEEKDIITANNSENENTAFSDANDNEPDSSLEAGENTVENHSARKKASPYFWLAGAILTVIAIAIVLLSPDKAAGKNSDTR